jgi:hypothetical protein
MYVKRVLVTLLGLLSAGSVAFAKPAFLQKAKDLGLPGITNCQACHISTEKGNASWNERGNWLRAKKDELKASEVDVAWLKDYKPAQ